VSIPISRAVEKELVRRFAKADSVFCFLDYDGTLSPLAPTPDEAVAVPGTSALVRQLATAPGVHVALVTGRPIADLRRFLDVPGIYYVGTHGLEVRLPNGETCTAEGLDPVCAALPELKRQLQEALGTRAGILIEDKGAALACHYRLARAADAAAARKVIAALAHDQQRRGVPITLVYGHAVAEIRPTHLNKGKAACGLLALHGSSALPIYIGDDRSDEDAFAMLPPESITIRVALARTPTHARYRLRAPSDVHRLLRGLLEARAPGLSSVDADHLRGTGPQ
jgi:trehalose-phosphatase